MEQIAGRAGVGIGTLYRRFPSKEELVSAVVESASELTRQIAELVLAESPAADGVFDFLRHCIATPSCWRVIASRAPWTDDTTSAALARVALLVERLLDNARRVDAVRHEVTFTDLAVLLMSVRAVADVCDPHVPLASARYLELVMDGLRPASTTWQVPPMTVGQLTTVLTGRGKDTPLR
jgi:AcrR family transcriptional regulator